MCKQIAQEMFINATGNNGSNGNKTNGGLQILRLLMTLTVSSKQKQGDNKEHNNFKWTGQHTAGPNVVLVLITEIVIMAAEMVVAEEEDVKTKPYS
jgi:hypothetical protein